MILNAREYEDGYYIININDLEKYSYGLICLVGEINGLDWHLYNKLNIEKSLNNIKDFSLITTFALNYKEMCFITLNMKNLYWLRKRKQINYCCNQWDLFWIS